MSKNIKLKVKNVIYILTIDDIIYCQSDQTGTKIYKLDHSSEHINANINELERKLISHYFWRTDSTHLINLNCLEEIPSDENTKLTLIDKSKIPIDKLKRKNLIKALEELR